LRVLDDPMPAREGLELPLLLVVALSHLLDVSSALLLYILLLHRFVIKVAQTVIY
jgi:hypothetical protein